MNEQWMHKRSFLDTTEMQHSELRWWYVTSDTAKDLGVILDSNLTYQLSADRKLKLAVKLFYMTLNMEISISIED